MASENHHLRHKHRSSSERNSGPEVAPGRPNQEDHHHLGAEEPRERYTLPLNEGALEVLRERLQVRRGETEYVFHTRNATRIAPNSLQQAFYSALRKSGIEKLRFHDLRHTFATRLVQAGVDLYTVQKLGRWKNISMIMRYAHHYPESLRSSVEVLDKIGRKISTNLAQPSEKGVPASM